MRLRSLLSCLLMMSCLHAQAAEEETVARLGDTVMTMQNLRQLAKIQSADALSTEALDRLVRIETLRRAVGAEARRQGFDKRADVAERMNLAAEQALIAGYVDSITRPPADYPSEPQIKEAYEAAKATLMLPRQYRLQQIYVSGTEEKSRKVADELYREVRRKGVDFAETARKKSQHAASAAKDGDMGWLAERDLVPVIQAAVKDLASGEIAKPVAGSEGYHILRLMDKKDPMPITFDQARPAITQSLRQRRAAELESAYLEGLLARNPLTVNGIALSNLAGEFRKGHSTP